MQLLLIGDLDKIGASNDSLGEWLKVFPQVGLIGAGVTIAIYLLVMGQPRDFCKPEMTMACFPEIDESFFVWVIKTLNVK